MRRKVLLTLCSAALVAQVATQPVFEVASIKHSKPGTQGTGGIDDGPRGNRFTATNITVRRLIMRAYEIADLQISGAPKWLDSDRYDIDAKPDHPVSREQTDLMIQALLALRFKLAMQRETEERSLFALLQDKAGSRLKLHEGDTGGQQDIGSRGQGHWVFRNVGMPRLAVFLSVHAGRAVVDKTGLEGRYDFRLDFTPIRVAPDAVFEQSPADPTRPELVTAVKEQLGLKLESQKGPVEILHVDHVERPTEN
jgi:uncharacterized protein (TIGR03435 family)